MEVLGVRQVRHLLEVGTEHPAAVLADPRHHLQLLVHHHVQLVGFLAVVEEFHDLGQVRPGRRVAVGAADRVHHRQAVAHADVSLGRGADQGAFAGVDDEGPVGALLAQQQLAEETQRAGRGVAVDARLEAPLDHEVGAFAATDLVGDDPPDHFGVGLVVEVESFLAQFQRLVRQQRQGLLQRQQFLLQDLQRQQQRAVVERLEAALGDLPVGNQRQRVAGAAGPGRARPAAGRPGRAVRAPRRGSRRAGPGHCFPGGRARRTAPAVRAGAATAMWAGRSFQHLVGGDHHRAAAGGVFQGHAVVRLAEVGDGVGHQERLDVVG